MGGLESEPESMEEEDGQTVAHQQEFEEDDEIAQYYRQQIVHSQFDQMFSRWATRMLNPSLTDARASHKQRRRWMKKAKKEKKRKEDYLKKKEKKQKKARDKKKKKAAGKRNQRKKAAKPTS